MFVCVLVLLIIGALYLIKKNGEACDYWKRRGVPHVPSTSLFNPKFFQLNILSASRIEHIYKAYRKHGFVGFDVLRAPHLLIRDPELVYAVCVQDFSHFRDKRTPEILNPKDPLTMHMVGLCGDFWKTVRGKLTPIFSSGKLKSSMPLFQQCLDNFDNSLKSVEKQDVDVFDAVANLMLDIIGSYVFGIEFNALHDDDNYLLNIGKAASKTQLWDHVSAQFKLTYPNAFKFWGQSTFNPKLTKFFTSLVKDAVKHRRTTSIERPDLIHFLLKIKEMETSVDSSFEFTTEMMAAQLFTFFIAGYDTSTFTITNALFEMAKEPSISEKARQEALNASQKHGSLTYQALMELEYLEQIIEETLRLHPVLFQLPRMCTADYQLPGTDVIIEKGTFVIIPAKELHRDPQYFKHPEQFNPERFSRDNRKQIRRGTFLPFGEGPRQCMGTRLAILLVKLTLASILVKYNIKLSDNTPRELHTELFARANIYEESVQMIFTSRNN